MPIFINGKQYEDESHMEAAYSPMLKNMGVDVKPIPPAEQKGDESMVQTPSQVQENKQMDKIEETELGGIPVSNRIYVGRTPLQASTEPAGEFIPQEATPIAPAEENLSAAFLQRLTGTPNPRPATDIIKDWVTEKLTGIYEALKLPGDAWQGKIDPMSPEGLQKAQELAGLMVMGPAPLAGKLADGTLGSFAGVKAKNAPIEDLKLAQKLEEVGNDADTVYKKTGWFRGADNRWKWEIPSQEAVLDPSSIQMTKLSQEKNHPLDQAWFSVPFGKDVKLPQVLKHPELYDAYPFLKNITITPTDPMAMLSGLKGSFNGIDTISLSAGKLPELKSVLLHEVQHAIQQHEGFSYGANANVFKSERWKNLDTEFQNKKKETESIVNQILNKEGYMLSIEDLKKAIRNEDVVPKAAESKWGDWSSTWSKQEIAQNQKRVDIAKELGVYDALKKVVHGETIRQKYDNLLFDRYESVMGEVEARNVQTRMNMGWMDRYNRSPQSTEDIPRANQINSPYDPAHLRELGPASSQQKIDPTLPGKSDIPGRFEPVSPRWPNNDNARPLNESEQFIKDYDELHKLGQTLGTPVKNKRFGELRKWSDLDYQKYNKAGRAFAKKHGQVWEDVKPVE